MSTLSDVANQLEAYKGGKGSGNFGHSGRPGKIGGSGGGKGSSVAGIANEKTTAPPPGDYFNPDVHADKDGDGVTDTARVGVPAHAVPPPPEIPPLPNLTADERRIESEFRDAFHNDPDGMAKNFLDVVKQGGDPPTFGTDDAKVLHSTWSDPPQEQRSVNRAIYNTPLHQTANAIAKRAFVQHLDTLKPGDELLVTVGGVGAGKGYALKNVPAALEMKQKAKAVWDSAGDQNATENSWIQKEAEARGLKVNYAFVHADPKSQWANPERGVVKRAGDPKDGRMVDAKVFADSYAIGAKNHQAFYEANKTNPNASFVFLDNTGAPKQISGIPKSALNIDRVTLANYATKVVNQVDAPPHVKRGATVGDRIWENY